ncbi:hypothetical protein Naga_101315g2, partial [Nannochloropsis gaditana]
MDQTVSLGGSAPEERPATEAKGFDWAEKREEASRTVKETAAYLQEHGQKTVTYLKTHGAAAAGAAAATSQRTREEVVREWIKSTGLGSIVYRSLVPGHWRMPAISLGVTLALLAAAIAIVVATGGGALLILMLLVLTLFNQMVHAYCDGGE